MSRHDQDRLSDIAEAIAVIRDHLTHHYFDTDHAIVQDVIDNDLELLSAAVHSLIDQTSQGDTSS